MANDIPVGIEAQKLINISLGKIAASRAGRTGASLHKSLLVASVLHKARYVYMEETHYIHQASVYCPSAPEDAETHREMLVEPPRAPTPLPEVCVPPDEDKENRLQEKGDVSDVENVNSHSDQDHVSFDQRLQPVEETDNRFPFSDYSNSARKRRRVSELETEAAISSILPKRPRQESTCTACDEKLPACICSRISDDSSERTYDYLEEERCNMEVEQITSLVSIFSFTHQQAQCDLCSTQAHQGKENISPPVLALTA